MVDGAGMVNRSAMLFINHQPLTTKKVPRMARNTDSIMCYDPSVARNIFADRQPRL